MLGLGAMGGFRLGAAPMAMPLASAICRLLALGLPVETRLAVLKQQPEHDETARRALESDDGASFVTVAQAEAIVVEHVADAVVEMHGELAAANRVAAQSLANTTEHFGAWIQQLERDIDSLRSRGSARRCTQTRPRSCDPTGFQTRTDECDGCLLPGVSWW